MLRVRKFFISVLALCAATVALAVPAQTANATVGPGQVTQVIVWGDSMALSWGAYLEPLLGVPVIRNAVGSTDVQDTETRLHNWLSSATAFEKAHTGHICWCGHVNNNTAHQGTAKDITSVVPTLQRMRTDMGTHGSSAAFFMPMGLTNAPLYAGPDPTANPPVAATDTYNQVHNSPPYNVVTSGTAVNEQMLVAFGKLYAEVREYLVTDGLRVAGLTATQEDLDNIRVDVPPRQLRRDATDPHLSEAGKRVTAERLDDLIRANTAWIPPSLNRKTTTDASSNINPSADGQSIRINATVTNTSGFTGTPTGSVQFFIDGRPALTSVTVPPSGVVQSSPTAGLTVGTHSIQAVYSGDSTFASSEHTYTHTVTGTAPPVPLATTTSAVSSPASPTPYGTRFQVIATVTNTSGKPGTPTGTVQFKFDGKNAGTPVTLTNGTARSIYSPAVLASGTHTVSAIYTPADSTYAGSSITYNHIVQ
ncbi:MAG: Ig-like domain repeat protein [Geodermatophilaceae bacterium]|nr:Ig-like domain repeat protein [Geodermatophilaceae bacterium]